MALLIRSARTSDIQAIRDLITPYVEERVLLGKELVVLYEATQEFLVAELDGRVVGAGALHIFWEDLAEIRTLVVDRTAQGHGIGHKLVSALIERGRTIGVWRIFCLTFEVDFFTRSGFTRMLDPGIDPDTYVELVRSPDEGVAEFLELQRVKQNTLGNTRMILHLDHDSSNGDAPRAQQGRFDDPADR
ncbi:amino-acid N-acetyltransferase [Pseudoclavibacter sp. CFCC 13796]|uniref:amino-acid N-acetyltransferase n=1 Tax=Pseudoclavibacter sp. CFCC 13796 TaxID=2615179 RepID=UPI00178805F5|nr:amino-acid N-acetyltransferase [Pseudoclavibacter sp. CFCC 13796]